MRQAQAERQGANVPEGTFLTEKYPLSLVSTSPMYWFHFFIMCLKCARGDFFDGEISLLSCWLLNSISSYNWSEFWQRNIPTLVSSSSTDSFLWPTICNFEGEVSLTWSLNSISSKYGSNWPEDNFDGEISTPYLSSWPQDFISLCAKIDKEISGLYFTSRFYFLAPQIGLGAILTEEKSAFIVDLLHISSPSKRPV